MKGGQILHSQVSQLVRAVRSSDRKSSGRGGIRPARPNASYLAGMPGEREIPRQSSPRPPLGDLCWHALRVSKWRWHVDAARNMLTRDRVRACHPFELPSSAPAGHLSKDIGRGLAAVLCRRVGSRRQLAWLSLRRARLAAFEEVPAAAFLGICTLGRLGMRLVGSPISRPNATPMCPRLSPYRRK